MTPHSQYIFLYQMQFEVACITRFPISDMPQKAFKSFQKSMYLNVDPDYTPEVLEHYVSLCFFSPDYMPTVRFSSAALDDHVMNARVYISLSIVYYML